MNGLREEAGYDSDEDRYADDDDNACRWPVQGVYYEENLVRLPPSWKCEQVLVMEWDPINGEVPYATCLAISAMCLLYTQLDHATGGIYIYIYIYMYI